MEEYYLFIDMTLTIFDHLFHRYLTQTEAKTRLNTFESTLALQVTATLFTVRVSASLAV